jgi:endonuclease/exonuclease/phosphatase family metal-dependent hydrolase
MLESGATYVFYLFSASTTSFSKTSLVVCITLKYIFILLYFGGLMMRDFRIGTFNFDNLDDSDPAKFNQRKTVLKTMLERINADLLFLQEVHSINAVTELIKGTRYEEEQFHMEYTRTKSSGRTQPYKKRNLVILSKYPIQNPKHYYHDLVDKPKWKRITTTNPTAKDDISWERPVFHCEIKLGNNKILHGINLHLKSKIPSNIEGQRHPTKNWLWFSIYGWGEGYFISAIKRVGQALEARILVDNIFKNDSEAAIVVAGDFNGEIDSVPFKTIVGSMREVSNPDLGPFIMVPCEFNVPLDQRFSLLHHGKGNMLDHVIVSKSLYPYWKGTEIFNELVPDKSIAFSMPEYYPESDHAPVIATFKLPDNWFS